MKLDDIRKWKQAHKEILGHTEQDLLLSYLTSQGLDPDKLYQELEMSSRYVDTHQDISSSNGNIQLHSHSFHEVLYCCNTCGVEYLVGTERYRLQKGDIIFVPPGISHRPLIPENMEEPYRRYVLWMSPEFIGLMAKYFSDPEFGQSGISLLRTAGTKWEILEHYFYIGIQENQQRAPGWEAVIMGNTMVLLSILHRAILDKSAAPLKAETPELLDQVIAYIETHLAQKITLGDTAKHFYVSQSTISQTFRQKMGVSFYRCVTQRRLIAAKALIEKGHPMETVAEQVGFSDYSSFFRAFKQEYGISPRQYRKLQGISSGTK